MTVHQYVRGYEVDWVYRDTKEPVDDQRPCPRCGRLPTKEGYDACLGYIKGVKYACCGHGVQDPYVTLTDGTYLCGERALEYINKVKKEE